MAVTRSDTALIRAEKAFAGMFRGFRDPNMDDPDFTGELNLASTVAGGLLGVPIHEGRTTQQLVAPAVVVHTQGATRQYPSDANDDFYNVQVEVTLTTNIDERDSNDQPRANAGPLHDARALEIENALRDQDWLRQQLNKPADPDPDNRPVDGFLFQYLLGYENFFEARDNLMVETFRVEINCAPWDPETA